MADVGSIQYDMADTLRFTNHFWEWNATLLKMISWRHWYFWIWCHKPFIHGRLMSPQKWLNTHVFLNWILCLCFLCGYFLTSTTTKSTPHWTGEFSANQVWKRILKSRQPGLMWMNVLWRYEPAVLKQYRGNLNKSGCWHRSESVCLFFGCFFCQPLWKPQCCFQLVALKVSNSLLHFWVENW